MSPPLEQNGLINQAQVIQRYVLSLIRKVEEWVRGKERINATRTDKPNVIYSSACAEAEEKISHTAALVAQGIPETPPLDSMAISLPTDYGRMTPPPPPVMEAGASTNGKNR